VFGTAMLIIYAGLQALNGHSVRSSGTLEQGPDGLIYRNAPEGIEVTVPESWTPFRAENTLASLRSDGASFIVQEQFATYAVASMLDKTEKDARVLHPDATFTPTTAYLAGRFALGREISYVNSEGVVIHQRVLGFHRTLKICILIETWTDPEKRVVLDRIEQSFRLN
jgi:hypothetical protein